jgi:hypothetical protein
VLVTAKVCIFSVDCFITPKLMIGVFVLKNGPIVLIEQGMEHSVVLFVRQILIVPDKGSNVFP